METQTKLNIGYAAIILILAGYAIIGDIEPTHYCEAREIQTYCTNLTKYYGLENGKCLSPFGNKLCRSGWEEIPFIEQVIRKNTHSGRLEACGVRGLGCEMI